MVDNYSDSEDIKAEVKALLEFAASKNLDKLDSKINEFNPFKVLRIQDHEIRHSNVLAWLIDPNGHHGLGDTVFKNFLFEILKDHMVLGTLRIEDVIGASFEDLYVLREWRKIDILAVSETNDTLMVIENKVNADESKKQLGDYVKIINEHDKYGKYKKVFVFLTLDGTAPKGSDSYVIFTHEQVYDIVRSTVEIRKDYMNSKVYDFIQQYLKVLEGKTMQETELTKLCGEIYKEHKDAINMIIEYGKPRLPSESMKEFHIKTETESFHQEKKYVPVYYSFIPSEWKNLMPTTNKYSEKYLVFAYFNFSEYEKHKIMFYINIGNFPDTDERERFVKELRAADKDQKLKVNEKSKTSTSVFSKAISLKDGKKVDIEWDNYDAVKDKLIEIYNSDEVQDKLKVICGVVTSFKFRDAGK